MGTFSAAVLGTICLDEIRREGSEVIYGYGGLFYSLGVIFYVWKTLVYHHAIWHLFVLAGSACHFFAVFLYVIPGSSAL